MLMEILILALATSAISVTVTKGAIFSGLRSWIINKSEWSGKLLSCPYCFSHWIAFALVMVYRPVLVTVWYPFDLIISVFVVVAVSAIISGVIIWLLPFHSAETEEIQELRSALEKAKKYIAQIKKPS